MASLTATFATRRDAEMAVEHIVQEHGLDRRHIMILAASPTNSSGTAPAGGDLDASDAHQPATGSPELTGRLSVTATADETLIRHVRTSFETYGGELTP